MSETGAQLRHEVTARTRAALQQRDELLNGEIFCSLKEAQVVIEQWRRH